MTKGSKNIAGLSMRGGKKDNFFFCLLEYYEKQDRWFLRSLLQVKDEEGLRGDDAIRSWIEDYNITKLVVDFPLTLPLCHSCELDCPGTRSCPVDGVVEVREMIDELLREDKHLHDKHPKQYERLRNLDDLFDHGKDILSKEAHEHILSKPFKRKLKKGFLPYWNRPVDFWIWYHYYDQMLELFNSSYDSCGNTSLMILSRFSYLRRHFPKGLNLFEGNVNLTLLEMHKSEVVSKNQILDMYDIEIGVETRLDIVKAIEKELNIFIYDNDLELLVKNSRAFNSFIMAIIGQRGLLEKSRKLPKWSQSETTKLIIPTFS